jgi:hypothetical protein
MNQADVDVKAPILSQPQFCEAAGVDMMTANNWIARGVLKPSEIGGRQIKGTRLYSITKAFEGRIIAELVKQGIGPAQSSEALVAGARVASVATRGGWVEHWARAFDAKRPFVSAFMVLAWSGDCYDAQLVSGNQAGWPDFSAVPDMRRRFFGHPFVVLPIADFFLDVWKKSVVMLKADRQS